MRLLGIWIAVTFSLLAIAHAGRAIVRLRRSPDGMDPDTLKVNVGIISSAAIVPLVLVVAPYSPVAGTSGAGVCLLVCAWCFLTTPKLK